MSTSAVPAVIDYLVATATANTNLGASTASPVAVYDGPQVTDDSPTQCLWIGVDVAWLTQQVTGAVKSADSSQSWVGVGGRHRDEQLSILCVADAYSGDTMMKTARDLAYAVMSAFEDMTRIDANAGGNVLFTNPGVTNAQLLQGQTDVGARALVAFEFRCDARIGTP